MLLLKDTNRNDEHIQDGQMLDHSLVIFQCDESHTEWSRSLVHAMHDSFFVFVLLFCFRALNVG